MTANEFRIALRPREQQILPLLADGYCSREIGEILFLSQFTVRSYIGRVRMEFMARNVTLAITEAIRLNVLVYDDNKNRWKINENSLGGVRVSR